MKRVITLLFASAMMVAAHAKTIFITVKDTRYQTVTGFGAACCDGAMCPYGSDTKPVQLLYGKTSKIGLNIMRMEISPNFKGDITAADIGWDTPYDWNGSLPSAKLVKQRGGIVFGTPWSPPGEYKTNGSAQGGNSDAQGNIRAELREDCYEKFFPWLNSFLKWMKTKTVKVDAVSIQNEPDWWVSYSGCLYTPDQQLKLVKNYAHMLDRETYPYVRLISAEPLGFDNNYYKKLLNDATAREQIDIIAGHIYGHRPLDYIKTINTLATKYNKEIWMTEHSVSDNIEGRLPTWHEQLLFAEELNECMVSGCTGYIYWYMRAHWAFVGTGETSKYGSENKKNVLLPRAYVYSHFAKHVTGSTRISATATGYSTPTTEAAFETSAYIKGDSLIVVTIDTTKTEYDIKFKLPVKVKSGTHLLSTGNKSTELCQSTDTIFAEPAKDVTLHIPGRSLSTFIFMIQNEEDAINETLATADGKTTYYDMLGRTMHTPQGLYIERRPDGTTRKILKRRR